MRTNVITVAEMRAIDKNAVALGMNPLQLMENAGSAVADVILKNMPQADENNKTVWFFAGLGNNGGDTFVAARRLADKKISSIVFLLGAEDQIKTAESKTNYSLLKKTDFVTAVEIKCDSDLLDAIRFENAKKPTVLVDGIFGTGFSGKAKGLEKNAIEQINQLKQQLPEIFVLAIDLPSGMAVSDDFSDSKSIVKADAVITFHKMKSFLESDSNDFGKIIVEPIGTPDYAEKNIGVGDLSLLYRRNAISKKGDSGKVLVIAGGAYAGAPALAGMAALRVGCDIATIAAPKSVFNSISSFSPELIVKKLSGDVLSETDVPYLIELIQSHDSVIIGPGFGTAPESLKTAAELIPHLRKAVIDADMLRPEIFEALESAALNRKSDDFNPEFIITPHYNEFLRAAAYFKMDLPTKRADNSETELEKAAAEISRKLNAIVLLKGPTDLISNGKSDESRYNLTGNSGMSVGGTGDVLAGAVGGLLSKNKPIVSACCGAFICGSAGDLVFRKKGNSLIPSDILEKMPTVIKNQTKNKTKSKNEKKQNKTKK